METDSVLQQIVILTEQESARDLKKVFLNTVDSLFDNTAPVIFEIHEIRDPESEGRENSMIAVDSLDYNSSFLYIDDIEGMQKAVTTGEITIAGDALRYHLFLPIRERNSINHVIACESILSDEEMKVLKRLVSVFANNLYLLNIKDRDPLTSFYNRQAYNRMINPILFNSGRDEFFLEGKKCFTFLAVVDIDHFKAVNDVFGHLLGDEVLILFSRIIRNAFRHDDLIFRYGGEEFIIIIKDVDLQYAKSVFERCRKNVESYHFPQVGRITISLGYTSITGSRDPLIVLDKADRALYYSKREGRNRCSFYEELVRRGQIKAVVESPADVEFWS